jgi:hypothetical protein
MGAIDLLGLGEDRRENGDNRAGGGKNVASPATPYTSIMTPVHQNRWAFLTEGLTPCGGYKTPQGEHRIQIPLKMNIKVTYGSAFLAGLQPLVYLIRTRPQDLEGKAPFLAVLRSLDRIKQGDQEVLRPRRRR